MNDTASALTHASRANVFQTEARWRLGADALVREGGEPASAPGMRTRRASSCA